jgi:hypothetical protein
MKSKRAIYKMLELCVASAFGSIAGYFITKFYDTGNFNYFWGFGTVLIGIAVIGYIFYLIIPYDSF